MKFRDNVYDLEDVARILGRPKAFVAREIIDGRLPYLQIFAQVFVRADDLQAYIERTGIRDPMRFDDD